MVGRGLEPPVMPLCKNGAVAAVPPDLECPATDLHGALGGKGSDYRYLYLRGSRYFLCYADFRFRLIFGISIP